MTLRRLLSVATGLALLVSGLGWTAARPAHAADYRWKFSSPAPTTDPAHTAIEFFAKRMAERTGGQAQVTVFPGGQLGQHREVIQGLQSGAIELAFFSSTWLVNFIPEFGVLDLPYLVTRKEEVGKLLEGEVGQALLGKMPAVGLRGLSFSECSFRGVFTKKPVKSAAELKGLKLRVPGSPIYVASMKAIGVLPTPLAFGEVYSAIQQGVVDGAENTASAYFSYKFFEVAPHWTHTNHAILPGVFMMSERVWQRLPAEIQRVVAEVGREAGLYHRKIEWEVGDDYLGKARARGATTTEIDLAPLARTMRVVYPEFEEKIGRDLMAQVRALFPAQ